MITTKAKEYALRLMEQASLFGSDDLILESHVFGLGSGSKPDVLAKILDERQSTQAMMVEDNLQTLHKIQASKIQDSVLPVLASWGYNTAAQQETAKAKHYVVLDEQDSSSLSKLVGGGGCSGGEY